MFRYYVTLIIFKDTKRMNLAKFLGEFSFIYRLNFIFPIKYIGT
jgi:hypothetical protein